MSAVVRQRLLQGLLCAAAATLAALTLEAAGWLQGWENRTWDWRARSLARPGAATDQIVLILLDQNSLDWGLEVNGLSWPWPREVYAGVADFCRRSGARALAFDVQFTEPSLYGVADDEALAAAMERLPAAVAAVFAGRRSGRATRWPADLPDAGLSIDGLDGWLGTVDPAAVVYPRAAFPIPALARAADLLCNVHLQPDADGTYRRVRPFSLFDGRVLPTLGLGAYWALRPQSAAALRPGRLQLGERSLPLDAEGRMILRYRGPSGTHRTLSAAAVLQSEIRMRAGQAPTVDPKALRGKYVLFGFSAPGLLDLRPAPVDGVYPGVEIQATLLDNLLSQDFIWPTPFCLSALLTLGLALSASLTVTFLSRPVPSAAAGTLFLVLPVLPALAGYGRGFWVPLMAPLAAVAVALAAALLGNYIREGRQRRFIKSAFKQYLSPAVIEQLLEHPERLVLGGERRELTIFFSDLQGFTGISESLAPEALTALLNDYLTAMTDIIQNAGGTVDKYEGDAIIAFWNAPLDVPEHPRRAVEAALACQRKLDRMRPALRERTGHELRMRIGINTGPAVVGNLGSHSRFDYTMLGDAVNLAARLEGANKQFGTYSMISDDTRRRLGGDVAVRELARLAVVGRREPVTVYEPMAANEAEEHRPLLESFAAGLGDFYRGRFESARDRFGAIADADPAARAYLEKCDRLLKHPPDDWQGVWIMSTK